MTAGGATSTTGGSTTTPASRDARIARPSSSSRSASGSASGRASGSASERRRRTVIVTYTPGWGGTEKVVFGLVGALAARGQDVVILQLGHHEYDGPVREAGLACELAHVPEDIWDMTLARWREVLRGLRCEVCVVAKGGYGIPGGMLLDLAARLYARRYLTIENAMPDPFPRRESRRYLGGLVPGLALWWWQRKLRAVARAAAPHRVLAVSEAVRERLVTQYSFAPERTHAVHVGIDDARFRFDAAARAGKRRAWGVPADAYVFGAVGRLHDVKNYAAVLPLFARLLREHESAAAPGAAEPWLVLAGDGPEREALARSAATLGIAHRVAMPGWTSDPEAALSALDCFLMPSRSEGFGLALAEAMATGCACVAYDVGGPGEIIADPSLGWLVPREDAEAFLAAMRAAMRLTPSERADLAARARRFVEERFSAPTQFARLARLVETV